MTTKKIVLGSYLLLVHAALAVAVVHSSLLVNALQKVGIDHPAYTRGIERVRSMLSAVDELAPSGAVVFLGDSITDDLPTAAVTPYAVNLGVGWQRSDQLLAAMDGYSSLGKARAVSIMIGTNDLAQGRLNGLGDRYRAILSKVPTNVPVVLSSPPPLVREMEAAALASQEARDVCQATPRCTFVDLHAALIGPDGTPIRGALRPGGVHLTASGYTVWIGLLRRALLRTMSENSH